MVPGDILVNDNAVDYVEKMGPGLVHVHISDLERMPPGTYTDFSFLIDELRAIDYQGYLAMEIGLGGRGIEGNSYAKKAFEYMKSII